MEMVDILLLLLRAVPEAVGVMGAGTVLIGKKLPMRDILSAGVLGGFAAWGIRMLPVKFGIHTILALMALIVIQRIFLKLSLKSAIAVALLGFITLGALEYITLNGWVAISGTTFEHLLDNYPAIFLAGLPSLLGLYLIWFGGRFYLVAKDG